MLVGYIEIYICYRYYIWILYTLALNAVMGR
jgi:hypothetical protein